MRKHRQRQRVRNRKQRVSLSAVASKIIDHDGKTWPARRALDGRCSGNRHNQMNGLRTLAAKQVIKAFHAWRGGTRNPLQVMNLCDPGKFLLDRIVRGAVRHACTGKWNRDVNVIDDKSLSLA